MNDPEEEVRAVEPDDVVPLVADQGEGEEDRTDPKSEMFSAAVGSTDWTIESLVNQMRKGRIDLDPTFQRRNAWLDNRKSKLIESIILGFPIPQIVLAEQPNKPGFYFVLDGKQRLLALRQYFVDESDPRDAEFERIRLIGLENLSHLNRLTFSQLDKGYPEYSARLENHTIRTVFLSQWNSEDLLLSLFLRLNSGSVPLSPQELRQALIPGKFMQWLDAESSELHSLQVLLGNSHADRRMVDAELALRHLAFATSPLRYTGNLKKFLDDTSRVYNKDWGLRQIQAQESILDLESAIEACIRTFGRDVTCRKWNGERFERALNRAVFDVQVYSMSFPEVRDAVAKSAHQVMETFKAECSSNESFVRSISTTTKTLEAFQIRHRTWAWILRKEAAVEYPIPMPLQRN